MERYFQRYIPVVNVQLVVNLVIVQPVVKLVVGQLVTRAATNDNDLVVLVMQQ